MTMNDLPPPDEKQIAEAMRVFDELSAAEGRLQPCSLAFYRETLRGLPRPTAVQVENFVRFDSKAHSWYKHLPLLPPGAPFVFCLDPMAGYDRSLQPGGQAFSRERTETSKIADSRWPA